MPFLPIEDGRIHYEDQGSGYPVLLFAPGFLSARMERWAHNPARPGVAQDWLDPRPVLAPHFRLISLDVRNAGQSRAALTPDYGWGSYTADHVALLRHLGITHCHVMGACIGVSFAYALAQAMPGLVTAMVLQNPIGLADNRAAVQREIDQWASQVAARPGVDASLLPAITARMFGGDFLYSVTRDFVASCDIPALLMPGDDTMHPGPISADILRLVPRVEQVFPWKGPLYRGPAMQTALEFVLRHTPPAT